MEAPLGDLFPQIVSKFLSSAGPINISTTAVLVSPGVAVPGQISITSSEVYFEVDEDHDDFKKIDPQVGRKETCGFRTLPLARCDPFKLNLFMHD